MRLAELGIPWWRWRRWWWRRKGRKTKRRRRRRRRGGEEEKESFEWSDTLPQAQDQHTCNPKP